MPLKFFYKSIRYFGSNIDVIICGVKKFYNEKLIIYISFGLLIDQLFQSGFYT